VIVFLVLAGVLVSDLWTFSGYVPIWDGWCYLGFASKAFQTGIFDSAGHSSIFQTFLMAASQYLGGEGSQSLAVLMLLQILLGVLALRWVLARLGGPTLDPLECTLGAFLLGLDPVLRVHILQPSLDGPLAVHLVLLLAALVTRNRAGILLAGSILIATKETGVALYGVLLGLHVLLVEIEDHRRRADWTAALRWALPLTLPMLAFASWMFFHAPHDDAGRTWMDVIQKVFAFNGREIRVTTGIFLATVVNFSWILTTGVFLGLLDSFRRFGQTKDPQNRQHWVVHLSLLFCLPLLVQPIRWLNARYIVSLRPLLVLSFMLLLGRWLPRPRTRKLLLLVLILLFLGSHFWTIDPVSRWVFGTFRVGQHELLYLPSGKHVRVVGFGRDQLFYNSQATFVHRLTEAAYKRFGTDRTFAFSNQMSWLLLGFKDFRCWDRKLGRRRFGVKDDQGIALVNVPWRSPKLTPPAQWKEEVIYLAYPNLFPESHQANRSWISRQGYHEAEVVLLDDGYGYTMEAFRFRRNEDTVAP
jgi:hypothetical protein